MKTNILRHLVLLTTLGCAFSSLTAQTVPLTISYQGSVTDSAGVGLGTGSPVNRKVLFRIYDAAALGTKLWTEEQTVVLADGVFSVLLGTGAAGTGNATGEPRPALDTVFTSAGVNRFIGVTVDNGDNSFNASDVEIAPRQQIASTPYAFRARVADTISNGTDLMLNNSANYGLGYYGSGRLFNGVAVDGPVLYGAAGGALGAVNGTTQTTALRWTAAGNVGIGTNSPSARLSLGASSANSKLLLFDDGTNFYGMGIAANQFRLHTNTTADRFTFLATPSNGSELMTILGTGNVGIGTTSPSSKLHVIGTVAATSFSGNGAGLTGVTASIVLATNISGTIASGQLASGLTLAGTTSGTFSGSGAALTALNASNVSSGTLADGVLSGNVALLGVAQTFTTIKTFKGGLNAVITQPASSNGTSGTQFLDFSGTERGYIGNVGNGNAILPGAVAGDFAIRASTGDVVIASADANGHVLLNPSSGKNVGIGTSSPVVPLHVATMGTTSINAHSFPPSTSGDWSYSSASGSSRSDVSIYVTGAIHMNTIRCFSDERIKNIQGISNSRTDLDTLLSIQITDYRYKDNVTRDSRPQKKVIAQQVEKVFPQAVSQSTDVVPDIFQKAAVKAGWIELKTNLKKGERVRLIAEKDEGVHEVLEVREGAFRTSLVPKTDSVFVYGREVKDFRTVDYEAISMLNVSATQEIARRLEAKTAEVAALEERVKKLEARDKARDAKLAAFEKLLDAMDKPAARTVSLKAGQGAE